MVRKKSLYYDTEKIITDGEFDADEIGRYTLVLQINQGSLLIGVFRENLCLAFETYKLDVPANLPHDYVQSLEHLSNEHRFLGIKHWKKIIVLLNSPSYALVPSDFFSEENANLYLQHNAPASLSDNYLHFSAHANRSVYSVFAVEKELSMLFERLYPNTTIQYSHTLSVFADLVISSGSSDENELHILIHGRTMSVVRANSEKLLFGNNFSFGTKEDFLYFALLTAEKTGIDNTKLSVKLYGEVAKDAGLVELLRQYAPKVIFGRNPERIILRDSYFSQEDKQAYFSDFFAHIYLNEDRV